MDQILAQTDIITSLHKLNVAWAAVGNDFLVRTFHTADFAAGVDLVGVIASVAGQQSHYPDINLTYNRVEVRTSTHSVAGITERDIALAAAIDQTLHEN